MGSDVAVSNVFSLDEADDALDQQVEQLLRDAEARLRAKDALVRNDNPIPQPAATTAEHPMIRLVEVIPPSNMMSLFMLTYYRKASSTQDRDPPSALCDHEWKLCKSRLDEAGGSSRSTGSESTKEG